MKVDEVMDENALREAEAEGASTDESATPTETHAAKWARPPLAAFDAKEKNITFQVGVKLAKFDVQQISKDSIGLRFRNVDRVCHACNICRDLFS